MLHEILFPLTQLSLHGFRDFFEACFQGVGVEILYSAYWICEVCSRAWSMVDTYHISTKHHAYDFVGFHNVWCQCNNAQQPK